MNRLLSALVVVALVMGTGYWYHRASSRCPIPLAYAIGDIDERFELTEEEARSIVSGVESRWEDRTGRNLFTYEAGADFTINFVYDERQRLTEVEHTLREVLDRTETVSSSIRAQYEELLEEYEKLRARYAAQVEAYENRLAVHNGEVAYWNNEGGAPPDTFERLNEEERRLAGEHTALEELAAEINEMVDEINRLGTQGNETVREYNDRVREYNSRFHHEREFTQGDYQGDRINIYQFADLEELQLVLAHELGHAISLDHVDDENAVMYYLMRGQDSELTFADTDLAEFVRVCGAS